MRQLVIGLVAAGALISSGVAQARPGDRPSERPSEYGMRGAGSVIRAGNPYGNVQGAAVARAKERALKATHGYVSTPAESGGRERGNRSLSSGGSALGMGGGVKAALNPYRNAEASGVARAKERALKATHGYVSTPAENGGRKASSSLQAFGSIGGGMGGGVKAALNPYRNAEASGIARGQERALKATHGYVAKPSGSSGRSGAALQGGAAGGMGGGLVYATNPYRYQENGAVAAAMARASARVNFEATPKGQRSSSAHAERGLREPSAALPAGISDVAAERNVTRISLDR